MNFFPPMNVSSSPLPNLQCKSFFARYKATRAKLRKEAASRHEVIDPNKLDMEMARIIPHIKHMIAVRLPQWLRGQLRKH